MDTPTPARITRQLTKLTKLLRGVLRDGEAVVAMTWAFSPELPGAPARTRVGRRAAPTDMDSRAHGHRRVHSVREALGMVDEDFTELPPSRGGYRLVLTDTRVLVLAGTGKKLLAETPVEGVFLQPVQHDGEGATLVFKNGNERVAVTTDTKAADLTDHFVRQFPDRRSEPRPIQTSTRLRGIDL